MLTFGSEIPFYNSNFQNQGYFNSQRQGIVPIDLSANFWRCRCTHMFPAGASIYAQDGGGFHSNPSIYRDTTGIPYDAKIVFNATVRSQSYVPDRRVQLAIWELHPDGSYNTATQVFPLETRWTTISLEHSKLNPATAIRLEVYWFDNNPVNIVLDLNNSWAFYR